MFENFCEKKILIFDIVVLIVGVKYKGEFEECLKVVIKEVVDFNGEVILFVDEIYMFIGVGGGNGVMDVANILKFVLVWGELWIIGVIILDEY